MGCIPPSTDVQRRLRDLWEDLLRVRPVGIRDNFFDLGGDSLLAARLFLSVNEAFGKDLSAAVLGTHGTIEELADLLSRPPGASVDSPLVCLQPAGSGPPFFLVHGLGGEVTGLVSLARHLGRARPCYGVQDPALFGRQEPPRRVEDMAARYAAEVLRVQPLGPYYLGGYSLGALIALELAQELLRQGHEVALVAVLDEPSSPAGDRFPSTLTDLLHLLANLPRWLAEELRRKKLATLLSDVLRKLRVWRRRLGRRTTAPVDLEEALDVSRLSEAQRRLMESHLRAEKEYAPQAYPGRVALFRARIQPLFGSHRPDLGWGKVAGGGVEVHVVPGDHLTLLREPQVQALAGRLSAVLAGDQADCCSSGSPGPRRLQPARRPWVSPVVPGEPRAPPSHPPIPPKRPPTTSHGQGEV